MRFFSVAACIALAVSIPTTVAAQEAIPDSSDIGEVVRQLEDPEKQEEMARMLGAMSEAMMAMPVGPMMEAMVKATGQEVPDIDRDATLAELAGPGAENLPQEISEKVPQMMGMMAGMAEGLEAMLPMLKAMGETMGETVGETMRERMEHGGS